MILMWSLFANTPDQSNFVSFNKRNGQKSSWKLVRVYMNGYLDRLKKPLNNRTTKQVNSKKQFRKNSKSPHTFAK